MMGEDIPHFPNLPLGFAGEIQLAYVQGYIIVDIVQPSKFYVIGGI
jgi:hypothetical protein